MFLGPLEWSSTLMSHGRAREAPASPALLRGAERVGQRSTSGGTVLPSLCGAALVASAASSLKRRKAATQQV